MKAFRASRDVAAIILKPTSWRRVIRLFFNAFFVFLAGKRPVVFEQETAWTSEPVWMFWEGNSLLQVPGIELWIVQSSGVPRNFFGGWGFQQIQLRAEDRENGDLRAVAP
jgi:hypothetical protein